MTPPLDPNIATRAPHYAHQSGNMLITVVAVEVLAMQHHPSVQTPIVGRAVEGIHRFTLLSAVVHGVMIAALVCVMACLHEFVARRDLRRLPIHLGWLSYASGVGLMIGAALTSGFVFSGVADLLPHDSPADLQIMGAMLLLCRVLNQSCANAATFAMAIGVALWSIDLLHERGILRALGLLGLATSVLPPLALFEGWIRLDVSGAREVLLIQSVWNLAVGFWLRHAAAQDGERRKSARLHAH